MCSDSTNWLSRWHLKAMVLPSIQCLYEIRGPKCFWCARECIILEFCGRCGEWTRNFNELYVIEMLRGSKRLTQQICSIATTGRIHESSDQARVSQPYLHMEQFEKRFTKQVLCGGTVFFFQLLPHLDVVGFWEFFEWTDLI